MKKKRINLWQKIQLCYRYHWMNQDLILREPVARPLWFMTHTPEQIQRRYETHKKLTEEAYWERVRMCKEFQAHCIERRDRSRTPFS